MSSLAVGRLVPSYCRDGFYLKRQNTERDALSPEKRQKRVDEGRIGDAHPDYRLIP